MTSHDVILEIRFNCVFVWNIVTINYINIIKLIVQYRRNLTSSSLKRERPYSLRTSIQSTEIPLNPHSSTVSDRNVDRYSSLPTQTAIHSWIYVYIYIYIIYVYIYIYSVVVSWILGLTIVYLLFRVRGYQLNRVQCLLSIAAGLIYRRTRYGHVTISGWIRLHWLRVPDRITLNNVFLCTSRSVDWLHHT